jgi:transcriptional regulator with XRE-family HTH domain
MERRLEIGRLVAEARAKKEISQFALARELGLASGQSISNIERGVIQVPEKKIDRLAEILELEANQLWNLTLELRKLRALRRSKATDPSSG